MYACNVQTVTEYFCALEQSNHLLLVARNFSLLANLSFVVFVVGQGTCYGSRSFSGLLERANGKVFLKLINDSSS